MFRVSPRTSASVFLFAAFLLAACASGTAPPPGVSTQLPNPEVSTLVAASRTAGPSLTPPVPSATPGLRLPLMASVLLRVRSGPGLTFDTLALMQEAPKGYALPR